VKIHMDNPTTDQSLHLDAGAVQTHRKAGVSPILVTGGTGTLGSLIVQRLRNVGCAVRVLSRHTPNSNEAKEDVEFVAGDLANDEGIEAALQGIEIIIHCAGTAKGDEDKTLNLVRAASRHPESTRARHLVYISVVGADRIPVVSGMDRAMFGYFASKLAAERVVAGSGIPWTTLRATQFHDLFLKTAEAMAKLPVIPASKGFRFQPIDAGEVADRLVDLAFGPPSGLVPEMGGPKVYTMADLLGAYLRASHRNRPIMSLPVPGKAAHAIRGGANLTVGRAVGRRTWEEFLAERVTSPRG
jgi:uncharacterized protein YbjT (DUF2867 family)